MRYLIDTNIFIFLATDRDSISRDVDAILNDPGNTFLMSAESAKELIVGYRKHSFSSKRWKTCEEMIRSIRSEFGIEIRPVGEEHILTYSRLRINENQGHKDPSDHIIIAHAITEGLPLISSDSRFPFYTEQGLDLIQNRR